MECLLTRSRCGVQCKISVTVAVTVSSLFLHVHNTKAFKSEGLFCDLYFCGCCGSILTVVQCGMIQNQRKIQNLPISGKVEPQLIYASL